MLRKIRKFRKPSEILVLLVLGVAIALAPFACGGSDDDNGNDGSTDAINSMTPG
jgi:hypothetical protein